jgi:hypothetical protein
LRDRPRHLLLVSVGTTFRTDRIAPALLRLCRASGRAVSLLDFSSVGRTGSRRVPGHSVVCCDYPSRGRSGYTSPTPRVRVPRHIARLFSRLVVDYFTYVVHPGASARRGARRRLLRLAQAHRRLLRLRRASGCLGMARGSSRGSSSTTSLTPRIWCLGMPRGSSSTTSPTPRVCVPRHVARLVMRLVVDYSVRRDFLLRPQWLYFSHAVRRDYLSRGNTGSTSSTPRAAATSSSGCITSTTHLD